MSNWPNKITIEKLIQQASLKLLLPSYVWFSDKLSYLFLFIFWKTHIGENILKSKPMETHIKFSADAYTSFTEIFPGMLNHLGFYNSM